jgi:hypothetical protein
VVDRKDSDSAVGIHDRAAEDRRGATAAGNGEEVEGTPLPRRLLQRLPEGLEEEVSYYRGHWEDCKHQEEGSLLPQEACHRISLDEPRDDELHPPCPQGVHWWSDLRPHDADAALDQGRTDENDGLDLGGHFSLQTIPHSFFVKNKLRCLFSTHEIQHNCSPRSWTNWSCCNVMDAVTDWCKNWF